MYNSAGNVSNGDTKPSKITELADSPPSARDVPTAITMTTTPHENNNVGNGMKDHHEVILNLTTDVAMQGSGEDAKGSTGN